MTHRTYGPIRGSQQRDTVPPPRRLKMVSISGTNAALLESKGEGCFELQGKAIKFHSNGYTHTFWASTAKEAKTMLNIFRAAPKYLG